MTASEQRLVDELIGELRGTGQSVRRFDVSRVGDIQKFRAMGRKAGRQLGWKIRTFQIDPAGPGDGDVIVTGSTPLHQELMRLCSTKALRRAFDESFKS